MQTDKTVLQEIRIKWEKKEKDPGKEKGITKWEQSEKRVK